MSREKKKTKTRPENIEAAPRERWKMGNGYIEGGKGLWWLPGERLSDGCKAPSVTPTSTKERGGGDWTPQDIIRLSE